MGVPAFYRWLAEAYPKVVVDVVEEQCADGEVADCSQPNPNGIEFDALYLDMNGIIHPCAHPEGRPPPASEEEMFAAIFAYIDRVFSVVRPRRVLFLAIDGPAPRAKMNQQRTRRFKAAKEKAERDAEAKTLRAELRAAGRSVGDEAEPSEETFHFDSNVITPGTRFMANLARWLRYFVQMRIQTTPGWGGIKVILSDASVPGEGEHKIMEHIRLQRAAEGYNPNTRHVIHGLDADLIMLALATHEPHFCILREVVLDRKAQEKQKEQIAAGVQVGPPKMQFCQIWTLREYLHKEFAQVDFSAVTGGFDLERVIDDFVFMCFFVGNDFLPHIPALEIRDGAIDMLIFAYKQLIPKLGGYLSDAGRVHLARTEVLLRAISSQENDIFERRRRRDDGRERAQAARVMAEGGTVPSNAFGSLYPPRDQTQKQLLKQIKEFAEGTDLSATMTLPTTSMNGFHKASVHLYIQLHNLVESTAPDKSIIVRHKRQRPEKEPSADQADEDFETRLTLRLKQKEEAMSIETDEVRFGESGWKDRYYTHKLHLPKDAVDVRRYVTKEYVHGLCWVLMYYYQGVQDWGWFYPFHYAPCASDLVNLNEFQGGQFNLGEPFRPFEQLMAVFPPASGHALPESFRNLMVHPHSPIIDFYPIDFRNDLNGKKFQWQAVALLPFIDAERLRASLAPLEPTLSAEEAERNSLGSELLFVSALSPLGAAATKAAIGAGPVSLSPLAAESPSFGGKLLQAAVLPPPGGALEPPAGSRGLPRLAPNRVVGVAYAPPPYVAHSPRLLAGVELPPAVLQPSDKVNFSRDALQATEGLAHSLNGTSRPAPSRHAPPHGAPQRMILGAMGAKR
ncbi:hypothetical protein AB1Y20_013361 [Prymnesium parvum]|uniref:5'-3' exoribonuclease n=1 Tax=Prymnesium parvum TaxID=97485 RepID=A0AB34IL45_PRYPA